MLSQLLDSILGGAANIKYLDLLLFELELSGVGEYAVEIG